MFSANLEKLVLDVMALNFGVTREPGETDAHLRDRITDAIAASYMLDTAVQADLDAIAMGVMSPEEVARSRFGALPLVEVKALEFVQYPPMPGPAVIEFRPGREFPPRPLDEYVSYPRSAPVDLARFPHACPRCGKPAYVGLAAVECSDGGCR